MKKFLLLVFILAFGILLLVSCQKSTYTSGDNNVNDAVKQDKDNSAINMSFGTLNTSVSKYLDDYSYGGGNYVKNWENSIVSNKDKSIYTLELAGNETNYNLWDSNMIITARGDVIIGIYQGGFQVSDIDNTYQLLKWLGGNAAKLIDYEPEIIRKNSSDVYLKWEVKNGYMVIRTTWYDGLTDWKKSIAGDYCIYVK